MIRTLIGNLFDSEAQTLVNTVNCVGIMGKGIALEFKKRFPDMFEEYAARCERGEVKLGRPYVFKRLVPPWILNFPTKDHWRSVSRLSDIVEGLKFLGEHYKQWGITSLAVPPLGCGHGGLEWRVVGPTLYRHLNRLDIPVEIYAPHGTPDVELGEDFLSRSPEETNTKGASAPRIRPSWIALVEILARVCDEPYHWPIGRTSFQKIAYFGTQAGLPTDLHFKRGSYGPFSADVKPLVTRLVNNGLICERRLGRMFAVEPGPTYEDSVREFGSDLKRWEHPIEKIADLFLRMDTKQAELAATVDFAARGLQKQKGTKPTEAAVLEEVMRWKQKRRPPLDRVEVAHSIRNLNLQGWLDLAPSDELEVPTEDALDV